MKQLLVILLLLPLLCCSCQQEEDNPAGSEIKATRTVLVYMMAQNSLNHFAIEDINEMLEGMKDIGNQDNLLVYVDETSASRLLRIGKDANGKVVQKVVWSYGDHDSTDPKIMYEILTRSFAMFPADGYGLIFWSHGEGWLPAPGKPIQRWFGQDTNSYMNISSIAEVLRQVTLSLKPSARFEFIMFDACYMQSVEVLYALRHYADYFIGSPIEIPGPGAPYQKIVKPMFAEVCDVKGMAEAYFNFYTDSSNYPMKNSSGSIVWLKDYGVAISLVKSIELETLARLSARFIPQYSSELANFDVTHIQSLDARSQKAYYDLGDFMYKLLSESEYRVFEEQLNKAVPYAQTTKMCYSASGGLFSVTNFSGLSTYVFRPAEKFRLLNQFVKTYDWYTDAGWSKTGW